MTASPSAAVGLQGSAVGGGSDGGRRAGRAPRLQRRDWAQVGVMGAVVVGLHALGWGLFVMVVLPRHLPYPGLGIGIGAALTAYTLGVRHAFDADHISAIDNVTRKLMADGKRPLGTGFFFSLGHSSLIVATGIALAFAARAVMRGVVDPHSTYERVGAVVGTAVSGGFLYLIAALNLAVLAGIARTARARREGTVDDDLERHLGRRGLLARLFARVTRAVSHPWQMAPVGTLFALGFDTASEVLLLAATAAAASQGMAWYSVLALPLLFAAGMTLFDTADGLFMNLAYGWAFADPGRKLTYNLVVTALSVIVAFGVGSVELLGLGARELHLGGEPWRAIRSIGIDQIGLAVVALFAGAFLVAGVVVHRSKALRAATCAMPGAPKRSP